MIEKRDGIFLVARTPRKMKFAFTFIENGGGERSDWIMCGLSERSKRSFLNGWIKEIYRAPDVVPRSGASSPAF